MDQIETQTKEVNDKFRLLVRNLGANNTKGTVRYQYEVDFAHAINEIRWAPSYIVQKYVDKANLIVSNLIKDLQPQSTKEA